MCLGYLYKPAKNWIQRGCGVGVMKQNMSVFKHWVPFKHWVSDSKGLEVTSKLVCGHQSLDQSKYRIIFKEVPEKNNK